MMLYNQTDSTVWLFKGHPIAARGGADVPKWLAESPGVLALIASGVLGHVPAAPPEPTLEAVVPAKKSTKKAS